MKDAAVTLRELTAENRDAVLALRLGPGQDRFVSSVAESLAEAAEHPEGSPWYRAVYAGDEPVGFVMLSWDCIPQPPEIIGPWFLWKLLIDERHQRLGYGRQVVRLVADLVRAAGGDELLTSYVAEGAGGPGPFYTGLGFRLTGEVDPQGEIVASLDLREVLDDDLGWEIDSLTLRPRITDERRFRSQHTGDPALEAIVALWTGDPDKALELLDPLLDSTADNWRLRALRADARRDLGDLPAAIAEHRELVSEHAGTSRDAVLVQHLGKAYFAAEDYDSAASCFERALSLRTDAGADGSLVSSSSVALQQARRLARSRQTGSPEPAHAALDQQ